VAADGRVIQTLPRDALWLAQTPQVFRRDLYTRALANRSQIAEPITDDAQLVEAIGHPVQLAVSDLTNLKITVHGDIALANAILKSRPAPKPKGFLKPFEEAQW
jgi:2-C-methyl-D-erythritol 4-phosphate cytidylyltransferase